ncbi:MAG: Vitamin B12 dependent methionine synthase activation subunit [Clostridia bacterium]|nr:Vitamin B12 dependent methionine synthase activation subunit [Clostridia bacterium]
MLNKVFVKTYAPTAVDEREVLRYAGYRGEISAQIQNVLSESVKESENAFSYRVCYLATTAKNLLDKWQDGGNLLCARLQDAQYAIVFAATVGLAIDRLILKEESVSPTKALLLQALGAERIESLCDAFCNELKTECEKKGYFTGVRFSAGYGDFPLEKQKDIFAMLSPEKTIGLTLNDSLLMSPTKSVTAIIPIGKKAENLARGCAVCNKKDCQYKK